MTSRTSQLVPSEPRRVVVAGDWHGNTPWAQKVIRQAATALAAEDRRIIVQLGDFGIWPGRAGRNYLSQLDATLAATTSELWFVDGNHEDFRQLARLRPGPDGREQVAGRIWHLPRGYRWTWHGRTWLALGGGVSLDKAGRHRRRPRRRHGDHECQPVRSSTGSGAGSDVYGHRPG